MTTTRKPTPAQTWTGDRATGIYVWENYRIERQGRTWCLWHRQDFLGTFGTLRSAKERVGNREAVKDLPATPAGRRAVGREVEAPAGDVAAQCRKLDAMAAQWERNAHNAQDGTYARSSRADMYLGYAQACRNRIAELRGEITTPADAPAAPAEPRYCPAPESVGGGTCPYVEPCVEGSCHLKELER